MEPVDVAQRYFDAWNRRDAEAIAANFAPGGTYNDPTTDGDLTGNAIAEYASGLFGAYPDLSFEIVSNTPAGPNQAAAQWIMRGTNTGSYGGGPPTGKTVELPGADFIAVSGNAVQSVRGYFDRRTIVDQLGLQVIVQPHAIGPVTFGYSVHLGTGKRTKPGAFSLTALQIRSQEEVAQVRGYSRGIMSDLVQMPGFVSALTAGAGDMMFTVAAWETPEHPGQLLRGGAHKEAMNAFFTSDLSAGGATSVWVPHHENTMWVRCASCAKMNAHDEATGVCTCGETLPDHPPYW
ncbi:MAG: ester cyclase [Chloroflexota bacterium]